MRVAAEISSRETPRISRSRLRCSPKGVKDVRTDPGPRKNIGAASPSVNAARRGRGGAGPEPLVFWQSGRDARCSRGKRFTIMQVLPGESTDAKRRAPAELMRRADDPSPFEGVERRRTPGVARDLPDSNEVNVFHELGKALTSSLQLDQVLSTIMEKINEVLRPDTWSFLLMDLEKGELFFQIATGKGAEALKDVRIKVGQGLAGWVAQTGEVVGVADTSTDSRFFKQVDAKTKMETRSIVAVPVRFREQCLGVIELINCVGPEGFSKARK